MDAKRKRRIDKLRGEIEKAIVKDDALPQTVGTLLAGIITGLRDSTKNPPEDDKGSRIWQQDKVNAALAAELEDMKTRYYLECRALAAELEDLKLKYYRLCEWRNRAGLPRKPVPKSGH